MALYKLVKRISVFVAVILLGAVLLTGCSQVEELLASVTLPEITLPDLGEMLGFGEKTQTEAPTQPTSVQATGSAEEARMPQCVGLPLADAITVLNEAGFVGSVVYAYSDRVPEGSVISQSVPEGEPLAPGGTVTITISRGPADIPENTQKVVVSALSGSSYGRLALFNWENGQWIQVFSCDATVGQNGIGFNYGEGKKRTPAGEFKLGVALSAKNISNRDWPFYRTTTDTCIVDDSDSAYYNTIQSIQELPNGTGYDPVGKTLSKSSNVLIYIEHNGDGLSTQGVVPEKGSVITICGKTTDIKPTAGCVDISASDMNALIEKLDYSRNPVISISAT